MLNEEQVQERVLAEVSAVDPLITMYVAPIRLSILINTNSQ